MIRDQLLHWLHDAVLALEPYLPARIVASVTKPIRRWAKERRRAIKAQRD